MLITAFFFWFQHGNISIGKKMEISPFLWVTSHSPGPTLLQSVVVMFGVQSMVRKSESETKKIFVV